MKVIKSPIIAAIALLIISTAINFSRAAEFVETSASSFGSFISGDYIQYRGRFQGSTELGEFDVPFEFIAPAEPAGGNATVLLEPPHFTFGTSGVRDLNLTPELLFNRGFSYAAVGFGDNGLNVLDPSVAPIIIAGETVANPGEQRPDFVIDREIIVQFAQMLRAGELDATRFGTVERVYATGVSQTAEILESIMLGPDGPGLFDLYLLVASLWEPDNFPLESLFPNTRGTFVQPDGVGKMVWVMAEGDLLISNAEQYLNTVGEADSRLYQVAGGAHLPITGALGIRDQLPFPANGLDWSPVVRAAFINADRWVRFGEQPPPDQLFSTTDEVDPVYEIVTGIARDENLNALGGVRLPPVETGRFNYVAALPDFEIQPGLPGLVGSETDLECEPLADGSERFPFPALYDWLVALQAMDLVKRDLLLKNDGIPMIFTARDANVGRDSRCESTADPG